MLIKGTRGLEWLEANQRVQYERGKGKLLGTYQSKKLQ